jgi:hypothetical protein
MDRNLGASRAAINPSDVAAYGDLYQWGRFSDGHQCRNSVIQNGPINSDRPDGFFIQVTQQIDWRTTPNNNLWQSTSGNNNPCPFGFRLPSDAEFLDEFSGNSWFNSPLKLTLAGYRSAINSSLNEPGTVGYYWTRTINSATSIALQIINQTNNNNQNIGVARAFGFSVRCIKD